MPVPAQSSCALSTSCFAPSHLFDDVSDVQQSLLVHDASMEDAGDGQLTSFHLERHTLKQRKSTDEVIKPISTVESQVSSFVLDEKKEVKIHKILLHPTRCSPATLRMPTMRMASGGGYGVCSLSSSGAWSTKSHGLGGGLSQVWDATESWVSSRDWQAKK